jgi:hypothetical protein
MAHVKMPECPALPISPPNVNDFFTEAPDLLLDFPKHPLIKAPDTRKE